MFFLQGLSGVPGQPGEPGKEGKRVSKQHQLACGAACLVVVMTARCLVWGEEAKQLSAFSDWGGGKMVSGLPKSQGKARTYCLIII